MFAAAGAIGSTMARPPRTTSVAASRKFTHSPAQDEESPFDDSQVLCSELASTQSCAGTADPRGAGALQPHRRRIDRTDFLACPPVSAATLFRDATCRRRRRQTFNQSNACSEQHFSGQSSSERLSPRRTSTPFPGKRGYRSHVRGECQSPCRAAATHALPLATSANCLFLFWTAPRLARIRTTPPSALRLFHTPDATKRSR